VGENPLNRNGVYPDNQGKDIVYSTGKPVAAHSANRESRPLLNVKQFHRDSA